MMGMMGAMMGFMIVGVLFFIVVLAVAIWLLVSFLNRRQTPPMPYTPPPQNPDQRSRISAGSDDARDLSGRWAA